MSGLIPARRAVLRGGGAAPMERDRLAALAPFERACVCILRHYCVAWSKPGDLGWERAFDAAAQAFGDRLGGLAARRVLDLMRAFRASRSTVFRFNNPSCAGCSARLTDGERLLAAVMRAVRDGDASAARASAIVLCEGGPTEPLLLAARALGALAPELPVGAPWEAPRSESGAAGCCGA
jgi:hypothetical protein